ncbi:MAG: glycoside hydrolase family 2 protein, partial [Bacteroidota bacterium]
MNRISAPLFLFCIVAISISSFAQDINIFSLDGAWKFRRAGTREWMPAKVPGVVHLDLMRNNAIPDPFAGDNESKVQWIGDSGWEYMKTFQYGEGNFAWRHIELVSKGLDTYANVYLNDSLILVSDNMFREWYVDIKRYLHIGTNTLRIQFPSVNAENKARYGQLPAKLPGDEKVVCRKAAYQFGWDWGPALVTSGIWRPIYIRKWGALNVINVQIIQKELSDSAANLAAQFTMFAELDNPCEVRLFLDTAEVLRQSIVLKRGPNILRGDITLKNPERWWPNGMGSPKLYHFRYEVYFDGQIVAKGNQDVGLRTIELVLDQDPGGRSFYFRINGIPLFIKGANYIPQDNFLPRVKDSTYRALVRDVKDANMNMLRVWGGGIYENDIFYDLCDENGILVWQDFMFACAMYPGGRKFFDNVRDEAIQNIVRLRRHASIALWCGNNEIDEGWKNWEWQKQYGYSALDSARIYKDYKMIFNVILPNNVHGFDTLRPYIPSSPLHGWGKAESMNEGDSHYWGVWWGKEPFSKYTQKVGRFMSEYGFQSFPDPATISRFAAPADRSPGSQSMKAHQKHPTGYETIDEYLLRDFRKPKDFESYGYVSQLLQAEGMKTAIEAHRRAKPYCMGTMFWQLNDCWPAVSWSSRDYFGKKKALQYLLPHLYGKILVSPVADSGHVKVYISSDELLPHKGTLTLKLIDFSGNSRFTRSFPVDVPVNTAKVVFDTLQAALLGSMNPAELVLAVTLTGETTHPESLQEQNLLYFASPKELALPVPVISKQVREMANGYIIRLSSDKLAKNILLSTQVKGDFSDNYFDLLPGVPVEVRFTTTKKRPDMRDQIMLKSLVDS